MAEQADAAEHGSEELELEVGGLEPEGGEQTEPGTGEVENVEGQEPEDELEISFDGEEAAPASKGEDSGLVKQLRAEIRRRDQALSTLRKPEPVQTIEVGDKPTLETCDYDEAQFEEALDAWKERKRQADDADAEASKRNEQVQQAWQTELQNFARQKTALKVRDFDAAEEEVVAGLSVVQQAIVIKAADNSAKVIYALGKHPERLKALAAIEDPIKFTAALVKLEGQLKVTTKRAAPEPESTVRGSASLSASTDKELERLEKDATRTGDRTKVVQYKRRLKAQGRS